VRRPRVDGSADAATRSAVVGPRCGARRRPGGRRASPGLPRRRVFKGRACDARARPRPLPAAAAGGHGRLRARALRPPRAGGTRGARPRAPPRRAPPRRPHEGITRRPMGGPAAAPAAPHVREPRLPAAAGGSGGGAAPGGVAPTPLRRYVGAPRPAAGGPTGRRECAAGLPSTGSPDGTGPRGGRRRGGVADPRRASARGGGRPGPCTGASVGGGGGQRIPPRGRRADSYAPHWGRRQPPLPPLRRVARRSRAARWPHRRDVASDRGGRYTLALDRCPQWTVGRAPVGRFRGWQPRSSESRVHPTNKERE